MDIAALQAFLAVAETGSFSRAAERIFLTQPAVSKRIAALEANLDARLFDRIGRTVQLTPAGQALLARTRAILRELDDVKR
jgi:DNA-binding transcriptional LysR family regulator